MLRRLRKKQQAKKSCIATVICTYPAQLDKLIYCVGNLKKGADRVILCYNDPNSIKVTFPEPIVQSVDNIIHLRVRGKKQGDFQSALEGLQNASENGCEYTLKINGDVFLDRPENIPRLLEQIGTHDFISPQKAHNYRQLSTLVFFGRTDRLLYGWSKIANDFGKQLELLWTRAAQKENLSYKQFPYAADIIDLEDPDKNGMWGEKLGFRHVHGEDYWAVNKGPRIRARKERPYAGPKHLFYKEE